MVFIWFCAEGGGYQENDFLIVSDGFAHGFSPPLCVPGGPHAREAEGTLRAPRRTCVGHSPIIRANSLGTRDPKPYARTCKRTYVRTYVRTIPVLSQVWRPLPHSTRKVGWPKRVAIPPHSGQVRKVNVVISMLQQSCRTPTMTAHMFIIR